LKNLKCKVIHSDSEFTESLEKKIQENSLPVEIIGQNETDENYLILDFKKNPTDEIKALLSKKDKETILFISEDKDSELSELLKKYPVQHVLRDEDDNKLNLITDILNTNINNEYWSLQKILGQSTQIQETLFKKSSDVNPLIEKFVESVDLSNAFKEIPTYLTQTVNELVTNAMFNAPVDGDGKAKYRSMDKRKNLDLLPCEYVTLKYGASDSVLAFSVRDQFGSLNKETIYQYLSRGLQEIIRHEDKDGGAGLGLALIRQFCHRLIFNISPGNFTEVICYIDKMKRFKLHQTHVKSIHVFFQKG
jgi:phosphoserine phosphatase RsbU/P